MDKHDFRLFAVPIQSMEYQCKATAYSDVVSKPMVVAAQVASISNDMRSSGDFYPNG